MPEMTLEEAKAYRASLCKPEVIELSGEKGSLDCLGTKKHKW